MDSDRDEIEKKQALLRTEIIDKNLDQEGFISFCVNKKPKGDDLTQWTYTEFQEIIEEFTKQEITKSNLKKEEKKKNTTEVQSKRIDKNNEEKGLKDEIKNPKPAKDNESQIETSDPNPKTKNEEKKNTTEVLCKLRQKSQLNEVKGLEVVIVTANSDNLLQPLKDIGYEIMTSPLNWRVRRRFSDFQWLRDTLSKYCPGMMVPPLPKEEKSSKYYNFDFLSKRMRHLQRFLDDVTQRDYFKASDALITFLSMTDNSCFQAKKKELSSFKQSPYIEEYYSFDGKILISSDDGEKEEKYFDNITHYFSFQTQLLDHLNLDFKNFFNNLSKASESLHDIHRGFETLHSLNSRVLMKEHITKSFDELSNFMEEWSKNLTKQKEIVKKYVKDFFTYIKKEGTAYEELIHKRDRAKNKYFTEKKILDEKKEELYKKGDIKKWEIVDEFCRVDYDLLRRDKKYALSIMCTEDTRYLWSLQKQFRFMNRSTVEELKFLIRKNCKTYIDNMKDFIERFYPTLTNGFNGYSSIEIFLDEFSNK